MHFSWKIYDLSTQDVVDIQQKASNPESLEDNKKNYLDS